MITTSRCQRCSRLPPPPPIFSLTPPPNLLSIDIHCPARLQHKKVSSPSSSIASTPIILGFIVGLFISITAILLIKYRMIKRQRHKYHAKDDHLRHANWPKSIPLLSDSCSSDRTISTPTSDYPCGIFDEVQHEYEQVNSTGSSHYYCLIYCRQCATYHQTSRTSCTCQIPNENSFFELQPMFQTSTTAECSAYS